MFYPLLLGQVLICAMTLFFRLNFQCSKNIEQLGMALNNKNVYRKKKVSTIINEISIYLSDIGPGDLGYT